MAKLRNPLFSFSARGTLARALTFRRRGQKVIAETKPIPKDARTSNQLAWRTMYQKCTDLWHTLSGSEKQTWEALARRQHMTGYNYYMSLCLKPNPGVYLPLAGGTMQGNIAMATNRILNLPAPVADEEPLRKIDGAGGAWTLVSAVDVTLNTTTVSFTGLDLDAAKLYDLYLALKNPTGATRAYWIYFNNDNTNANYWIRNLKGDWDGAADRIASSRFNDPYIFAVKANLAGACNAVIMRETSTGYPFWLMRGGIRTNPIRANGLDILYYAGYYPTAGNVTRIDITANAANGIGAGSKLALFKVS